MQQLRVHLGFPVGLELVLEEEVPVDMDNSMQQLRVYLGFRGGIMRCLPHTFPDGKNTSGPMKARSLF